MKNSTYIKFLIAACMIFLIACSSKNDVSPSVPTEEIPAPSATLTETTATPEATPTDATVIPEATPTDIATTSPTDVATPTEAPVPTTDLMPTPITVGSPKEIFLSNFAALDQKG